MEARVLRRPASSCALLSSAGSRLISAPTSRTSVRTKATSARTRRALKIAPHPSFLQPADKDRIVFNPPAAAPSVFSTPFKFLPQSDPRRRANINHLFAQSTTLKYGAGSNATDGEVAPLVNRPGNSKQHNLTKEDVAEMRRLRAEDPVTNSVHSLAYRFNCTQLFVMMCCQAPREHKQLHDKKVEADIARWGPRKAAAREERNRRREMLFRGEL